MKTLWNLYDANGYAITEGLQGPEVSDQMAQIAQRQANKRGQPVLAERQDGSEQWEFQPEASV